jgi:hypothetical protein
VRQARYNQDLSNTILIEFANKVTEKDVKTNPYSIILHDALNSIRSRDLEDFYYESEDVYEIDAFDQIFAKMHNFFAQKNYREVVLIARTCIEELTEWLQKQRKNVSEIIDYIDPRYYEVPMRMLGDVAQNVDTENSEIDLQELYEYCRVEIKNNKYKTLGLFNEFNDLFMKLSSKVNPDGFIELQDELLSKVQDKNSYEAERILQRKINLYELNKQPKKAWEIIESNIHFESFRKKLVEKKIKEKKYVEAKKLINDYLNNKDHKNRNDWNQLRLKIAQKENDTRVIREASFTFIQNRFVAEYFAIYKSTFTEKEWKSAFEQLFANYENSFKRHNNDNEGMYSRYTFLNDDSVFDLLAAENASERLMKLVEKHLAVDLMEKYYENFATIFPQETLLLFRKALDNYVENNTGHQAYEYLAKLLRKMQAIKGGKEIVSDMLKQYGLRYKNRRSLRDMISKFK